MTKEKKTKGDVVKKTTKKRERKVSDINALLPENRKKDYIKHRIDCKCILSQFKNLDPPIFHKFIVFSVIDCDGSCVPSYAQCNNCGTLHRVTEIGKSQLVNKESISSIRKTEEIKLSLPARLVGLLEQSEIDYPTWQEAEFVMLNQLWGKAIILTKDNDGNNIVGKYIVILGQDLYRIETFEKEVETENLISR